VERYIEGLGGQREGQQQEKFTVFRWKCGATHRGKGEVHGEVCSMQGS